MYFKFQHFIEYIYFSQAPYLYISIGLLILFGLLLSIGRRFESALVLERLGIPIALLLGTIALLIGPFGLITLLPEGVTNIWRSLPTPLLALVFASLMLGKPLPKVNEILEPVTNQALLGLLLGFGQYLVGGLAVLFILIPLLDVNPLMGCLIEVGFEGGHGAASVMGESFQRIGYSKGLDLGLAMATIGLLSSTIVGSLLVIIGRIFGWVIPSESNIKNYQVEGQPLSTSKQLQVLSINLALLGFAVIIGVFLLEIIRIVGTFFGGNIQEVTSLLPVFPFALIGSLMVRYFLEIFNQTDLVAEILQREIGILSTDLLIVTAMAGLDLPLLVRNWLPIAVLSFVGLSWNLLGMFLFGKICFQDKWFVRSIVEFGNATGVAATGLLLLRLSDPTDKTNTLPIFSIKQLCLQPFLSGGLITVIAPLVITNIGLIGWTELSGLLTILFLIIAVLLRKRSLFNPLSVN